jgi:hypothetical protein
MKISFESELMKNQKHAVVMGSDKQFEVLQSDDGDSLFFSIGDDGVLYLTRENSSSGSGWNKIPLSDSLKKEYGGVGAVRTFDVSQNAQTGRIDLALAFTVKDADLLYISQGHSNSDFAWAQGVQWTCVKFDGPESQQPAQIADIYLMQIPESNGTAAAEYIVADLKKADDPLGFYTRYYVTPSSSQKWNEHPLAGDMAVVQSYMLAGVRSMYAETSGASTAVWGLNEAGDLFRLQCATGSETDPKAWLYPVPLMRGVEQIASFLNRKLENSVIFAHMTSGDLFQLTQDPVSAQWRQRSILLPPTAVDDMVEYNSFTTHIKVTDDYAVGVPNAQVAMTATTRVGVYLNDVYHLLSDVPVNVSTDVTGVVTVVQETHTLSAIVYHVEAQGKVHGNAESAAEDINPMHNVVGKVDEVKSGSYLENKQVTNPDGTKRYLLPTDTKDRKNTAAVTAQALQQFSTAAKTLPPNSPVKKDNGGETPGHATSWITARVWGVSYEGDTCQFHEGAAAVARFGRHFSAAAATTDAGLWVGDESAFVLFWEDAWNWFMSIVHTVEEWFVHAAEDVWHFFVKIGETLYKVIVNCVSAVVRAVEFVFHKIAVFFEVLIKWLGFIFEWKDILHTHSVLKNVMLRYAENAIHNVGDLQKRVDTVFDGLQHTIEAWAGIEPGPPETVGHYQASSSSVKGQHSPASNWGLHHAKSNLTNATSKLSDSKHLFASSGEGLGGAEDIFDRLKQMVEGVVHDFQKAITQIKKDIIEPIRTLSSTEIIKRLSGILGDLLLGIAKDLIDGILEIMQDVIGGVLDMLTAPLNIPILTPIYSWLTETKENPKGDTLTFLDMACLVAAIPATIIYKLIKEESPFPDNQHTQSLIDAPAWASLQKLFSPDAAAAASLQPVQIFNSVSGFCSLFGAWFFAGTSGIKYAYEEAVKINPDVEMPKVVYAGAVASSLPYIMPNIAAAVGAGRNTRWPILNDTVTAVWFLNLGLIRIRRTNLGSNHEVSFH